MFSSSFSQCFVVLVKNPVSLNIGCSILNQKSVDAVVIASHPLNGWIWFGEGLRSYDNWQRCAASDFNQNEHGETAIPLKTVAATTPKSRAEEKLLRLI